MKLALPTWLTRPIRILPRRERRPPSLWERRIGKGVQVLFALCVASFAVWRIQLHDQISQRFAAIRAAGFPASPKELDRWYSPVPEASNAAVVLTEAFALLHTFPDRRSNEVARTKLLDRREPWSAETQGQIAEYVTMNDEALAKAREAVLRKQCRYPVDLSFGLEVELAHLSALKDMARVSALRAVLSAQEKKGREWTHDMELMLQLAATLDQEPTILSQVVRNTIISMAVQTAERCLNEAASDRAVNELTKAFAGIVNTNALTRGLIGDRAAAVPVFRMSFAEINRLGRQSEEQPAKGKPPPLAGRPNLFLWSSGLMERDLNFYLRALDTYIRFAARPPPACLTVTSVAAELEATAQRRYYVLSGMVLPALTRAMVRDVQTVARLHLVQTALAIERYRTQHGRLPESLNDLTPDSPSAIFADPFTGGPLRYLPQERGFVLYSVDQDGHDDGGRQKPLNAKSGDKSNCDLTFTVER